MFEDRKNDWLASELEREGYEGQNSNLDADHLKDENSRDWNAGAVSIKKEHEEKHRNDTLDDAKHSVRLALSIAFMIIFACLAVMVLCLLIELVRRVMYGQL